MSRFTISVTLVNTGLGVRILLGLGSGAVVVAEVVGDVSTAF